MARCFISVDDKLSVTIELFDNSVAKKFLDELKWHVANSSIDHREAFYGYADEAFVRADLLDAIDRVNSFLKTEFISVPSEIDWNDSDIYNHLHVKFEQLNGKWDRPTRLIELAPAEIKKAIRMINFSVHRLERRPYENERKLYLSWQKDSYKRQPLTVEEHDLFTNIVQPNTAYLGYVEVGKNLFDLYHDGLDPAYSGYENLHYVGAEIVMQFDMQEHDIFDAEFRQWAINHGIDLNDKMLGIGKLPIGTFVGSDNLFTNNSKITNIEIEE